MEYVRMCGKLENRVSLDVMCQYVSCISLFFMYTHTRTHTHTDTCTYIYTFAHA